MREADGYQSHLVSPEFGLKRLVDDTINLVLEPVNICVRRVHQVLLDAARQAMNPPCFALSRHVSLRQTRVAAQDVMDLHIANTPISSPGICCGTVKWSCILLCCSWAEMPAICAALREGRGTRLFMSPEQSRQRRRSNSCMWTLQGSVKEGEPDDGQQHPGREQGAPEAASL